MTEPALVGELDSGPESTPGRWSTLPLLWLLYAAQGAPFGFQATALVVLLREADASLTMIGFARLVALPWLFKPLWAPWVDATSAVRWFGRVVGRRTRWLLPSLLLLGLSFWGLSASLHSLALVVTATVMMNLIAAVMDVAVDGLAVDRIRERQLGVANIAQVVGYKVGMLLGGGLMLVASEELGWRTALRLVSLLPLAGLIGLWLYRERPEVTAIGSAARDSASRTFGSVVRHLRTALKGETARLIIVAVVTYKMGEAMADAMFKPFLLDHGLTKGDIGWLVGTWGMGFSIVGSFVGGLTASRFGYRRAVLWCAIARLVPLVGQLALSISVAGGTDLSEVSVGVVTCAEHFFGGALTTAMFALMMGQVDRKIGATHFTVLAALEVAGKAPSAWLSGVLADFSGYSVVFGMSVVASMLFVPVASLLVQAEPKSHEPQRLD